MTNGEAVTPLATLDAHQHYGFVAIYQTGQLTTAEWRADELVERCTAMDRLGVVRAVIMPGNSYLRPNGLIDTRAINDGIAEYCRARPDRFAAGLGVVEPLYGAAGLHELDRIAEIGLAGVSYHARFQGVATDDLWIKRHMSRIADLGLVPFVHTYADSALEAPALIGDLAATCPDTTIVVLDGFGTLRHYRECLSVATQHENLVFDTSQAYSPVILREFAKVVGAHRLVFGSSIYSIPLDAVTHNTPDALAATGFAGAELIAILGGTLSEILHITGV